jgi:hypothetical protein
MPSPYKDIANRVGEKYCNLQEFFIHKYLCGAMVVCRGTAESLFVRSVKC